MFMDARPCRGYPDLEVIAQATSASSHGDGKRPSDKQGGTNDFEDYHDNDQRSLDVRNIQSGLKHWWKRNFGRRVGYALRGADHTAHSHSTSPDPEEARKGGPHPPSESHGPLYTNVEGTRMHSRGFINRRRESTSEWRSSQTSATSDADRQMRASDFIRNPLLVHESIEGEHPPTGRESTTTVDAPTRSEVSRKQGAGKLTKEGRIGSGPGNLLTSRGARVVPGEEGRVDPRVLKYSN